MNGDTVAGIVTLVCWGLAGIAVAAIILVLYILVKRSLRKHLKEEMKHDYSRSKGWFAEKWANAKERRKERLQKKLDKLNG